MARILGVYHVKAQVCEGTDDAYDERHIFTVGPIVDEDVEVTM